LYGISRKLRVKKILDYVGLEEIDDGVWNVYFGPLKLGRFLERDRRIKDAYGRLQRRQ